MTKAQRFVQHHDFAVNAFLFHHVQAGDAKIEAALPHAHDDVAGPLKEHGQFGHNRDCRLILARIGFVNTQPAGAEKHL